MRVSRIEIFGFKSFMEKVVIPLEGGVTGVVGPNGCGKSNVVDALRWVLGETKASNLRGDTLEDVIFNGTDKLRPLGLAEVTITLRSSEANFFADLVSPSAEADLIADLAALEISEDEVQSESKEEGATEEAAPANEAGDEARPELTVISGGRDEVIADLAQAEPVESDEEPAQENQNQEPAPVVVAERDDERKSPTFLTRFGWLKAVNEIQITRRLYRSGESEFFLNRVPCRLKDLKDFFRAVGLGARSHTIVAQGEVSRIVTAKPEERRLILEDAAGVLGFRDKIASASRRLEETGVNISRIEDIIKEVDRQVSSLKRQAARAEAREELKARIVELEEKLFLDKTLELRQDEERALSGREGAQAAEAKAETELRAVEAREQESRSELMSVDVESDDLRAKMNALSEEIYQRERQRSDRRARVAEIGAFVAARGTEIRRLEERQSTLAQRKSSAAAEIDVLVQREQALTGEIAEFESHGEEELKQASDALNEKREALRLREQELRGVREEFISKQSSLKATREQLVAASPVTQLKETLKSPNSKFLENLAAQSKLLVDGLIVPAEFSRAAQAILAERAQFLVSDSPYSIAQQFVGEAYGASGHTDKKKRSGLGVLKSGEVQGETQAASDIPFKRLLDLVKVQPGFSLPAHKLLGGVFVADTLEAAVGFFEGHQGVSGVTLVTLDGDIVTEFSFYSLRHEGGLIQLKNKELELDARVTELERLQTEAQTAREAAQQALREAEAFQAEALKRSRERQTRVRELVNQRGTVIGRLQAERRTLEQVDQDVVKTQQQIIDCQAKLQELHAEEARLVEELKSLVPDQEQAIRAELDELQKRYNAHDKVRKEGRERLAALALEAQSARAALDRARAKVSELELCVQKVALERANLKDRIDSEFGPGRFEELLGKVEGATRLEPDFRNQSQEELQRLRARIAREGDVDPTSIERYKEERTRLDDLTAQRSDLDSAAQTLKRTIERLTETSERRFVATFNAVKENFSQLVPRLFGGGRGSLELLDPSKPLDSGVEIIARPPGKKLKSIELMSGGEKALCATALILGMFMEKPSPLCVLDEVDAPLDEANLVRFLTLIKEMSKKTQFILITHNKNSMATSDRLIGVTMQEPGASRTISVSLQEAYSQVA